MTATTTSPVPPDKAPTTVPPRAARQPPEQDRRRRTSSRTACSGSCSSPARSSRWLIILMAIFAPLIAPYSFDTYQDAAGRFPTAGRADQPQPLGHDRAGLRRDVARDLRRAHRGRGRVPGRHLLDRHRRPARPRLGLRRRLAGPHPGADHGRAVRVPVPAAGDRRRLPALGHDRQRHRRDGDRDHGRLRAAVLQSRASVDALGTRIHLHRGGAGDGREAVARSSASTCSATSCRACR